jgi:hypothetical protein
VRLLALGLVAIGLLSSAGTLHAQDQFYAASGSNGVGGTLYTLNPLTGAATPVGPLLTATGAPVGMTGMAFHPTTGVLYGSTANASPNIPGHLVTINPATGQVSDVGAFGAGVIGTCSDISFNSTGTLFGWESAGSHHLATINIATGVGTPIGAGAGAVFGGGGLAARPSDNTLFCTPDGSFARTLSTVNAVTGVTSVVAPLNGGPFPTGVINSMDFSFTNVLYGILSDRGVPANTHLVTLNQTSALITSIGISATDLDALAIRRIPEPGSASLLGLGVAMALGIRRRRSA